MRSFLLYFLLALVVFKSHAQTGFPVNGLADPRNGTVAFTNATIVKDPRTTLQNASMVVTGGKIIAVGSNITIPKEARVIDCQGKFIYPSFIDIYSDYGTPTPPPPARFSFGAPPPPQAPQKGPFGWNQAIRADANAVSVFMVDDNKAKALRDAGFGTVLTHVKDGIVRGTGTVVTLADKKGNEVTLKEKASAHYSFSKGSSTTTYPTSQMGSVALLRQTFLDAKWYGTANDKKDVNLSLQAFNNNLLLPQIFETTDKWAAISADRIGDEFGIQYIIKGGGNEYQRIKEVAATKASFILSLNYPQAMDVEDPNDARFVSLSNMQHWELAPTNPAALEKAGIPFCLTAAELRDTKTFMANLRKAIEYGLSENKALEALTTAPASMIGVGDKVGSLDAGKLANFIISSGPIFSEKTVILQNWVQGEKYGVKEDAWSDIKGSYAVAVNGPSGTKTYNLDVKSAASASIIGANDTIAAKFSTDGKQVKLSFTPEKRSRNTIRLSGISNGTNWTGYGEDSAGTKLTWSATLAKAAAPGADSVKKKNAPRLGKVSFPFLPYGNEEVPKAENLLIKNATVWTSDAAGKMENTDVLVKNGKIAQVGKSLNDASARIIDGTGKHLTPGIIDEHSHIAAFSINEGAESVTSEVRITDNLNPDDINIYRQLSGGVTTSHILHGSANTIGGQTQLIKLRWGVSDEELKFQGAPGFIKFALGENVKRSSSTSNTRFPDTRMGVEQVMVDAFTRAKEYEKQLKIAEENNRKKGATPIVVRRDLELDALVEILNNKRHITMHSYIQSEINAAMKVADKMGYKINTLTHILEGYKVADKMKLHGANASTFSDWWAYKVEVQDAIPYNAAIMQKAGLNVAINSDDAEMARRLNQEAAKTVKYGGISEEDALKMVTINPAKMLRVDDKVGSIKVGKDADLVLWSDHPLSVYAKAEKTIVDGTIYFDRDKDAAAQKKIIAERSRLIQKMMAEKREGGPVGPARPTPTVILHCEDHEHQRGLLEIEDFTTNND